MEAGCTYQLKQSVWDGSLFFGLAGFRKVDHVLLGQAMCLNAALQACVCVLVYHLAIQQETVRGREGGRLQTVEDPVG